MGKTVLFSPIGGTDPISINNMHDGSMLHICRYYDVDEIIMYMSKEILECDASDNRYERAVQQLENIRKRKMCIKRIERPNLKDVQEFDYFYKEFREILISLAEKMSDDDRLLINISSGTPAMKSGLLVLVTLGEIKCTPIQVTTPINAMNEHEHKGFDLDVLWELNPDNVNGINRCKEVKCPTLSNIQKQEIIKRHIRAYDYAAAVDVADNMPINSTELYIRLLKLAKARVELDNIQVGKLSDGNKDKFFPIWSSGERRLFEYALIVNLKQMRGEYADFLRAFTPLFVVVLEQIMKKECDFDINKHSIEKNDGDKVWKMNSFPKDLAEHLDKEFAGEFKGGHVSSYHLVCIADYYMSDKKLLDTLHKLREIESVVRNLVAHQITSLTEDEFVKKTEYSPKQVMDMIKQVFVHTGITVKNEYWNSYDEMNKRIIEVIDKCIL